ncbi:MAG: helix-turn-helix domain-containing protein [archaeon]|nr:helix-turn-helix domain-containing protein [archaeon]
MPLPKPNVKSRLKKFGEKPSMEQGFNVFKDKYKRSQITFGQFQGIVAGLAGTNHANTKISTSLKVHSNLVGKINRLFDIRDKTNVELIRRHHAIEGTKSENLPKKRKMAEQIMDLLKSGKTQSEICRITGADVSTVRRIRKEHPEIRSQKEQDEIRSKAISERKRKVSKTDVVTLLEEKIIRNGKIDFAHSFPEIRRRLDNAITLTRISQIAIETAKQTKRTPEINARLGVLASHNKLFENTSAFVPNKPQANKYANSRNPAVAKERSKKPWYVGEPGSADNYSVIEHAVRFDHDLPSMISAVTRRYNLSEKEAWEITREILAYYEPKPKKPPIQRKPAPALPRF